MSITLSNKRRRFVLQNGRCCWCGSVMTLDAATWEHIVPRVFGGTDDFENKALAHEHCNKQRGCDVLIRPHPSFLFEFVRERLSQS